MRRARLSRIRRLGRPFLLAMTAAALWLVWAWGVEHAGVRAPLSGLLLIGSTVGFIVVGVVGRGWPALLATTATSSLAGVGFLAVVIVDDGWGQRSSCDPGCLSPLAALLLAALSAVALTLVGCVLRRGADAMRRRHRSASARPTSSRPGPLKDGPAGSSP